MLRQHRKDHSDGKLLLWFKMLAMVWKIQNIERKRQHRQYLANLQNNIRVKQNVCNHGNYSDTTEGFLSVPASFFVRWSAYMNSQSEEFLFPKISLQILHVKSAKKPPTNAEQFWCCCSHHTDQRHRLSLAALTCPDPQLSARCVRSLCVCKYSLSEWDGEELTVCFLD